MIKISRKQNTINLDSDFTWSMKRVIRVLEILFSEQKISSEMSVLPTAILVLLDLCQMLFTLILAKFKSQISS